MLVKGILTAEDARLAAEHRRRRRGRLQPRRPAARHGAVRRRCAASRSSTRSAIGSTCSSTAGSGAGPTCSRRSRSARGRCWSGGRCCADWRSTGRPALQRVLEILIGEFDNALELAGRPTRDCARPQLRPARRRGWRQPGEHPRHRGHRLRRRGRRTARCCATVTAVRGFAREPRSGSRSTIPVVAGRRGLWRTDSSGHWTGSTSPTT